MSKPDSDQYLVEDLDDDVVEEPTRPSHAPPPPSMRRDSVRVGFTAGTPKPKLVKDVMSRKLLTIEPDTIIKNLHEYMEQFRFRHIPVVEGDALVGLITRGDLLHASASYLLQQEGEIDLTLEHVPASRIMQTDVLTVSPEDSLSDVAETMWKSRIGCVPVVDADGKLVGILTEADFLRVAHFLLD